MRLRRLGGGYGQRAKGGAEPEADSVILPSHLLMVTAQPPQTSGFHSLTKHSTYDICGVGQSFVRISQGLADYRPGQDRRLLLHRGRCGSV